MSIENLVTFLEGRYGKGDQWLEDIATLQRDLNAANKRNALLENDLCNMTTCWHAACNDLDVIREKNEWLRHNKIMDDVSAEHLAARLIEANAVLNDVVNDGLQTNMKEWQLRATHVLAQPPSLMKDSQRLKFVMSKRAFLNTTVTDAGVTVYQLWNQDEDENFHTLSGDARFFPNYRDAIDAAIQATLNTEEPIVPVGHYWRGDQHRNYCKHCGQHYSEHIQTAEATRCPSNTGEQSNESIVP